MSNENNEGIIIKGGVDYTNISIIGNSFPIEIPVELVDEMTIKGGVADLSNHSIPTMDGYSIYIGVNAQSNHGGRIKVARSGGPNKNFRNHDYYDEFYYAKGKLQRKDNGKTSKTRFSKKEIRQIEEFFMRNIDVINMNSNITKQKERIDDEELFRRMYQTELAYYKNGGR